MIGFWELAGEPLSTCHYLDTLKFSAGTQGHENRFWRREKDAWSVVAWLPGQKLPTALRPEDQEKDLKELFPLRSLTRPVSDDPLTARKSIDSGVEMKEIAAALLDCVVQWKTCEKTDNKVANNDHAQFLCIYKTCCGQRTDHHVLVEPEHIEPFPVPKDFGRWATEPQTLTTANLTPGMTKEKISIRQTILAMLMQLRTKLQETLHLSNPMWPRVGIMTDMEYPKKRNPCQEPYHKIRFRTNHNHAPLGFPRNGGKECLLWICRHSSLRKAIQADADIDQIKSLGLLVVQRSSAPMWTRMTVQPAPLDLPYYKKPTKYIFYIISHQIGGSCGGLCGGLCGI